MDKIKKVMTYKSGNFVFSRKYNYEKLAIYFAEADILNTTIKDIPILPSFSSKIDEELLIRSIFSTAAIEGNPLSEEKVSDIVLEKEEAKNDKQKEIYNLKTMYDAIHHLAPDSNLNSNFENTIKGFQGIITSNINYPDNIPTNYRNHSVRVGDFEHGGIDTPPKIFEDIKNLMGHFADWFKNDLSSENCYVKAALVHLYIGLIHPFGQGNGRTARAIEGMVLQQHNIKYLPKMLSNYYYRNIDDYYWAFSNTINSIKKKEYDVSPFLEFVMKGIIESFNELKERIMWSIKSLVLKDYYNYLFEGKKINDRQHKFLKLLIHNDISFSLKSLFKDDIFSLLYLKVSERTARRDFELLTKQQLLIVQKNGDLSLNFNILNN